MLTAVGLLTVAAGLIIHAAGGGLGAPLPPFFADVRSACRYIALIGLPVLALALARRGAVLAGRGGGLTVRFLGASR